MVGAKERIELRGFKVAKIFVRVLGQLFVYDDHYLLFNPHRRYITGGSERIKTQLIVVVVVVNVLCKNTEFCRYYLKEIIKKSINSHFTKLSWQHQLEKLCFLC